MRREHLQPSPTTTVCPWKGTASYYHVVVEGKENGDAAWYYPSPKQAAAEIKDHVAFWRGVEIVEDWTVRCGESVVLGCVRARCGLEGLQDAVESSGWIPVEFHRFDGDG